MYMRRASRPAYPTPKYLPQRASHDDACIGAPACFIEDKLADGATERKGRRAVAQVQLEARVLLGQGEASAARCTPAVSATSAIDRGRQRGRRSRPHQLDV